MHKPAVEPMERIERELTQLVRQSLKVGEHLEGSDLDHQAQPLERAAYSILGMLEEKGPSRLGAVAARFHLDASTVSRQVSALERQGLLVREVDPGDRRACRLGLSPEGEQALARTRSARRQLLHDLLSNWSEDDQARFAALLEQLNAGLDRRLETPDGLHRPRAV
ncbi:MAG TPA: MarR family transcriptional regulator [Actinomycetales bacterium]|nr:MarR family transcriptional regulator [Actinomycetales bacterium]